MFSTSAMCAVDASSPEKLEHLPFAIGERRVRPCIDSDTLDVAPPQLFEQVPAVAARERDFALDHTSDGVGQAFEAHVFREVATGAREHRGEQLLAFGIGG